MAGELHELHSEYAQNTTESEQIMTAAPAVSEPTTAAPTLDPTSDESPAVKRQKMMGSGTYKDSRVHQIAAQTWAVLELKEATEAQTEVIAEQTAAQIDMAVALREQGAAVAWNAQLLEAQVAEMRSQSQMQFYTIQHLLPDAVAAQMRVNLGISTAPAAPAAAVQPVARVAEPVPIRRATPVVDENDFS